MNCIGGYLKMNAGIVIGCLILLATQASVLGLCSTCLKKQCYENGECIIGCVPGYVGEYCKEECPSRCLNKVCHRDRIDGTITCTDGCQDGNCGIQCSENCQKDCVTCDRKCGSCNVTLCDERRYGAECRKICSAKYGKCDRETGQCIICRRGYYGDECNQECNACLTRAETIIDTCLSGCDICQSQETCPAHFFGDKCELTCSHGCADPGECNRATGECSAGCVSGYVGLTCDFMCSEHCLSGRCNKATGECSAGCVTGYHGKICNYTCSEHCLHQRCNKATGECSDGCVSGYHGLMCGNTCNKFCVGGICNQRNGICTSGCVSGYISNLDKCESNERMDTTFKFVLQIFIALGVVTLIILAVCKRKKLRCKWCNKCKTVHVENDEENIEMNYDVEGNPHSDTETGPLLRKKSPQAGHFIVNDGQLLPEEHTREILPDEHTRQLLPDEAARLQTRTRDKIAHNTTGMVRVSAVDIILGMAKDGQRWITITGNAGDGKTTLGYLVLKSLQTKYHVFTVDKSEEYYQIANIKGHRVIMFDDMFGAFSADEHLIKGWLDVMKKLMSVDDELLVIFISRKNVVNESMLYLGQFYDKMFDPKCVVDLSKKTLIDQRLNILEYHLQHENVSVDHDLKIKVSKKDIAHGFPHCCKMYAKLRSNGYNSDIEEFFETPVKFLDMTTKVLYRDSCKELFQLMIKNGGKIDVCTVKDEVKRNQLLRVGKEQEGSYINLSRSGVCAFAHQSVYVSVLSVINEHDPLCCVRYATPFVIRHKMLISKSDEEDRMMSPCYIIVQPIPAVLKALAERFRKEISKGDYSVFNYRLCQSWEFCEALVSTCVDTDKNENGSKQFINQPGKDGETMLWTAVRSGRVIPLQTLVLNRADVNIKDKRWRTPLHYLFQPNPPAPDDDGKDKHSVIMNITKLIIMEGRGDVNIRDQYGQTPLHYLCQLKMYPAPNDKNQGCLGMGTIRLIITEGGGDINIPDQYGHTPLHYLLKCNTLTKEEIHWIITEARGNLNKCEQNKSTPLHYLCAYSDFELDTVDLVITEANGDFNKGDEHGTTPLHFLCENKKVDFDVVHRIVNKAEGDINKQDNNGITPLHVLCKRSLQLQIILTLITQRNKPDRHGNTPLHYLCRTRGMNAGLIQQLEQMPGSLLKRQNVLGYTPLDYLTDQDGSLPWTDGMLCRSVADLVLCRFKQEDSSTAVLGPIMAFSPDRVHDLITVEDFGRQLTNTGTCGNGKGSGQVWLNDTRSSSPALLHPPSYWETNSRLTFMEEKWNTLLQMGLVEADGNLDKERCNSAPCRSAYVSVTSKCVLHKDRLCIQVFRRDQDMQYQIGECVTRSRPGVSKTVTFTFGLALDCSRGKVTFIDVEKGKILCKVDINFSQEVVPTFYVPSLDETFDTKMRLISGREIFVDNRKRQLIEQALSI